MGADGSVGRVEEGRVVMSEDQRKDDERLLARAEEALTQIKVSQGLSEPHAAVLAALRIRLKGDQGGSLEELLAASDDDEGPTLDDLFSKPEEPKRSLDDLLG
jgi:phosphoenolpyruvate synthase/pyruvate phosphate dikinase